MIFKSSKSKRERREHFQSGYGGGYCTHILAPTARISDSRFHQISRVELDPGTVIGEHLHTGNEEIYWVLSGTGLFIDDGVKSPAAPGDILLTREGHRQGLQNTGDEPLVFLAIVSGDPVRYPEPNSSQPAEREK